MNLNIAPYRIKDDDIENGTQYSHQVKQVPSLPEVVLW